MWSWLVLVVAACCACGGKGIDRAHTAAPKATVLVSGTALRYNDPPGDAPRNVISEAIVAALRDEATRTNRPAPALDARLSRACAALAAVVPEDGTLGYRTVEFALQSNGIIEPSPHLLVFWGVSDNPRWIVEQLRAKFPALARLGDARIGVGVVKRFADGTGVVVFAMQPTQLETSPIPRSLPAGGSSQFQVTLRPGLLEPTVGVLRPNGDAEKLELLWPGDDSFGAEIECGTTIGRLQIQITAVADDGPRTVAAFPVWCGEEPPASFALDSRPNPLPNDPHEAERQLLELINAERWRAGRLPIAWDEKLADIARDHSESMRRTNVVAFIVPGEGNVEERTRALAPDSTTKVRGGIARAYGISETHTGLIDQPTTRSLLMSVRSTQIGIGVVYGAEITPGVREMYVTELVRLNVPER